MSPRRTTNNAAAVVAFDDNAAAGWPNNNDAGSIFLANLTSDSATPSSWTLSNNNNSSAPQAVLSEVIDNPGGDVGSPGFVPGMTTQLNGDYSGNGVVDASDYVVWRHNNGSAADYDIWRAHFGNTITASGAAQSAVVPEPPFWFLFAVALIVIRRHKAPSHNRV
jgi:hypothetical protein